MSTMAELDYTEYHQIHTGSHLAPSPVTTPEEGIETHKGADGDKPVPWESSNPNRGWAGLRCKLLEPFLKSFLLVCSTFLLVFKDPPLISILLSVKH